MRFFVFLVVVILFAGCMTSPRNGDTLKYAYDTVHFEGVWPDGNSQVSLRARNQQNGEWEEFSTITSDSEGVEDSEGYLWYQFQADRQLPMENEYWTIAGDIPHRTMSIELNANAATFDVDANAEQCFAEQDWSGRKILDHCQSPDSPVVQLTTRCGRPGVSCCPSSGIGRDSGGCDYEYQGGSYICVHHSFAEIPSMETVTRSTCDQCGFKGQYCCNEFLPKVPNSYFPKLINFCENGLICSDHGRCVDGPCGGYGEPVCTTVALGPVISPREVTERCNPGLEVQISRCF